MNARLDVARVEALMAQRGWDISSLYGEMRACGWEGGYHGLYFVLSGKTTDPKLHLVYALSRALDVAMEELILPGYPTTSRRHPVRQP